MENNILFFDAKDEIKKSILGTDLSNLIRGCEFNNGNTLSVFYYWYDGFNRYY